MLPKGTEMVNLKSATSGHHGSAVHPWDGGARLYLASPGGVGGKLLRFFHNKCKYPGICIDLSSFPPHPTPLRSPRFWLPAAASHGSNQPLLSCDNGRGLPCLQPLVLMPPLFPFPP